MLRDRGILYAPDYVINAGGIINVGTELRPGGYDAGYALRRIRAIPETLAEVFARARAQGVPRTRPRRSSPRRRSLPARGAG